MLPARQGCLLLASMLLAACGSMPQQAGQVHPVWPPAPEPARIAHLRSFARAEDLGIARGFLDRLKDILFGESESRMVRPMAVVEHRGVIYVADPGVRGVHRFDTVHHRYRLLGAEGDLPLPSPVGLALCGEDVLVTDSSLARIYALGPDSEHARGLEPDVSLVQPTGIACEGDRVFVSDTASHRIRLLQREGDRLRQIGSSGGRGNAPGEFNFPTYLWWSAPGSLWVVDSLNFRLQVLDRDGRFVRQFGRLGDGSGDALRQKGVATDAQGHVYVADALFHAFQIYDPAGNFLLSVGARGNGPGEFWLPAGMFVGNDGTIYVADSYNGRVQVFRYLGAAP